MSKASTVKKPTTGLQKITKQHLKTFTIPSDISTEVRKLS